MTWVRNNFLKTFFPQKDANIITAIKNKIKKLYIDFLSKVINPNDYNEDLNSDFQYFFNLACIDILNKHKLEINNLYEESNEKPKFIGNEQQVKDLKSFIKRWYLNNLTDIYNMYIKNNDKFSLQRFIIDYWTDNTRLPEIYKELFIDKNDYNNDFIYDIKQFISNTVTQMLLTEKLPIKVEYSQYEELEKSIIKLIKNNIDELIPFASFPRESSGAYTHSWLGFVGTREDAKPIFKQLAINIPLANKLLKQINTSVERIEKQTNMSWKDFIDELYIYNYDEQLHLKVRDYLVSKNKPIHDKHGQEINDIRDKKGDTTYIKYNARADQNRSSPIVVVYSSIDNKNHILFGKDGTNHESVLNDPKYDDIFDNCYKKEDINKEKPILTYSYRLGRIAFVDQKIYNGYNSDQDVADILIKDSRIDKVYYLPPKGGGKTLRLAHLIY